VATEHKAVLDPLKHASAKVTYLGVGADGRIDPRELENALEGQTVMVSVMLANNEMGVLQPISEVGRMCRERGILFHCDAAQGIGKLPFHVDEAQVDLVSLSAHKLYGPKGVGALYVRRKPRVELAPLFFGGSQERGLRPGTLNVPGIVGLGEACALAQAEMAVEAPSTLALRNRLLAGLGQNLDGLTVNGSLEYRVPGNLNVSFDGVEGEALMLSMRDIAVSAGSACASASLEPSHVLKALGLSDAQARSALRFGIGRFNTEKEIDYVVARVTEQVKKLRGIHARASSSKEPV
jgi:cysteine desulfurase